MAKKPVLKASAQSMDAAAKLAEMAALDFEPLMTRDQLRESEAEYNETWGVKRRITMLALTLSRSEFLENHRASGNEPEVLLDMIDHVDEYRTHLKAGLELAEAARARLLIVSAAAATDGEVAHG